MPPGLGASAFAFGPGLCGLDPGLIRGPAGDVCLNALLIGLASRLVGLKAARVGFLSSLFGPSASFLAAVTSLFSAGSGLGGGLFLGGRGEPEIAVAEPFWWRGWRGRR